METPNTNNGRVCERIMQIFWAQIHLPTDQYNKAWEHVLKVLDEEYEEPEATR